MKSGTRASLRADEILPEQRLVLRAAGCRTAREATLAWADFRQLVPEGAEDPSARRLLPAVCRNLGRLAGVRDTYLLRAYAQSFGASARILSAASRAVRVLNGASIQAMALKGTALLVAHYRDSGIRPMADADLLVPEARIKDALDVLMADGWRGDGTHAWLRTEIHAGSLALAGTTLDLHRHALYEARYPEADDAFFNASVPIELMGAACRAMEVSDQLLHTVVHGLRWSIAPSNVWILDADILLRSGRVDPERVRSRAEALGFTVPLKRGLEIVGSVYGRDGDLSSLLAALSRSAEPWSARLEHRFRVREPAGLWGAIPNLWFAHLRSRPPGRIGVRGFPTFLARAWRLGTPGQLPAALFRKAVRRLRSRKP